MLLRSRGLSHNWIVHPGAWKQSFGCEPKSLVAMKGDTYLKKTFCFFQYNEVGVGGKHSKPTSCYKFTENNTGLIVYGHRCSTHTNKILPVSVMYNKSTKWGFNRYSGMARGYCWFIAILHLIGDIF